MNTKIPWLGLPLLLLAMQLQAQSYMNFTITQPAPPVAAFTSTPNGLTTAFVGQNTGGITTWSWNFGDGNTSAIQSPTHTFANEGPQVVCLTVGDQFGCTATTCDSLFLVGIGDAIHLQAVTVYPNPITANTVISYSLDQLADVRIDVLNLLGQSLKTICDESQSAGEHRLELGLELPAGIYLVRLRAEDQHVLIRINSTH